jgi:hypothetical protein
MTAHAVPTSTYMTKSELTLSAGVVVLYIVQGFGTMTLLTFSDVEQILIPGNFFVAHIAIEAQTAKIVMRIAVTVDWWYRCAVGFMTCLTATRFLTS